MKKGKMVSILTLLFFMLISMVACFKNNQREIVPVIVDPCSGTAGPLFAAVKTLITTKCVGCHNATVANGGMNFSIDCNIVTHKARIKVRAVDEGTMPPRGTLPAADKTTITNWINAGGKLRD